MSDNKTLFDHKALKDGIYSVSLSLYEKTTYRMEKQDGKWFFSDGTGWREEMDCPDAIVRAKDISGLPTLEKNTVYENTYPLTNYFPKHEADNER